eukprot:GILJ01005176.1.p1 GENE.GILJ01005176.1~~GILJ01005176.1.p1  ORF type:complete len:565 (-),score=88.19 GILJ01005176.1:92-1786(-)
MSRCLLLCLSVLSVCLPNVAAVSSSSVLAIEIGSEWIRVAIASSTHFPEIVLNHQSERKTPAMIYFKENGPLAFGDAAWSALGKYPTRVFPGLRHLLGVPASSPLVEEFLNGSNPDSIFTDYFRDSHAFSFGEGNDEERYTPEDIISMFFKFALSLGRQVDPAISKCVYVVPTYFDSTQKQALREAADLAKLEVIAEIDELTAVAVEYASGRQFSTPEHLLFFGAGAHAISAALIRISSPVKDGSVTSSSPLLIEVLDSRSDERFSAFQFDRLLLNLLVNRADEAFKGRRRGESVRKSSRAMSRLMREVKSIKEVLSTNQIASISLDELIDGLTFTTKVSRQDFETLAADSLRAEVILSPLESIMKDAPVGLSDIAELELFGGSSRIPFVQQTLQQYFNRRLGQHLNTDEAAVTGAAYYAGSISKYPRYRQITILESKPRWKREAFVRPLDTDGRYVAQDRLKDLYKKEERYKMAAQARSNFESRLFQVQDQMSEFESQVGSDSKLAMSVEKVKQVLNQVEDWLSMQTEQTLPETYRRKRDWLDKEVKASVDLWKQMNQPNDEL